MKEAKIKRKITITIITTVIIIIIITIIVINKQINNDIYELPTVIIKKTAPDIANSIDEKIRWIESLVYEDFELSNYKSHASLTAIMK